MAEKKSNSRKRTAVTIILLLIALLLGIERCINKTETAESKGNKTQTEDSDSKQKHDTVIDSVTNNGKRVFHNKKRCNRRTVTDAVITERPLYDTLTVCQEEKKQSRVIIEKESDIMVLDTAEAEAIADIELTPKHEFRLGVRAGAGYSAITSLSGMMESYNMRPEFTLDEKGGIVFRGGIFATWRYGRIGAELGADYMRLSGCVEKNTPRLSLSEKTNISCDVIAPQLMFRFYPFRDFYMSAGALMTIPFHTEVNYTTNRTGTVYMQQDYLKAMHLQESVKSRIQFMPALKIGYTNRKAGIEAAIEYNYGVNDLLRTIENDYGYTERTNNSHYVGVSLGYTIKLKE